MSTRFRIPGEDRRFPETTYEEADPALHDTQIMSAEDVAEGLEESEFASFEEMREALHDVVETKNELSSQMKVDIHFRILRFTDADVAKYYACLTGKQLPDWFLRESDLNRSDLRGAGIFEPSLPEETF